MKRSPSYDPLPIRRDAPQEIDRFFKSLTQSRAIRMNPIRGFGMTKEDIAPRAKSGLHAFYIRNLSWRRAAVQLCQPQPRLPIGVHDPHDELLTVGGDVIIVHLKATHHRL